jgi:hypothetical protein
MECEGLKERFSDYLDGILPAEERTLLEEHLKSCERCRESLAGLRKTIGHVRDLEEIEPPLWLTGKVMAKIRAEAEPKKGIIEKLFYPLSLKLPIQAVATVLIVATALYVFRMMEPEVKITERITEEVPQKILPEPKKSTTDIEKGKTGPFQKVSPQPGPRQAPEMKDSEAVGASAAPEPGEKAVPVYREKTPAAAKQEQAVTLEAPIKKESDKPQNFFRSSGAKVSDEKIPEEQVVEVLVKDIAAATKEIEAVLLNLNGKIVNTEYFENRNVLFAEIPSGKMNEFLDQLEPIGAVQKKLKASEALALALTIRITVVTH